jgi:hypothetical protein
VQVKLPLDNVQKRLTPEALLDFILMGEIRNSMYNKYSSVALIVFRNRASSEI